MIADALNVIRNKILQLIREVTISVAKCTDGEDGWSQLLSIEHLRFGLMKLPKVGLRVFIFVWCRTPCFVEAVASSTRVRHSFQMRLGQFPSHRAGGFFDLPCAFGAAKHRSDSGLVYRPVDDHLSGGLAGCFGDFVD